MVTHTDNGAKDIDTVLVDVDNLTVHYALRSGLVDRLFGRSHRTVRAVDGVSFTLHRGEVLGLVGESGSGKTTLGRAMLGMVRATSGTIRFSGRDVTKTSRRELKSLRSRVQMVFQDPHASLNPAMNLLTAIGHPLQIHRRAASKAQLRRAVSDALELVGLTPVDEFLQKYPSDLSGGQRQRAVIARAIVLRPEIIVADEPVSMLDMSVRSKVLQLMIDLKNALGLTYLYVTHDLATAKFLCDRIAILYLGRVVEIGTAEEIFADPKHPYTRALLDTVPDPDLSRGAHRRVARGEIPDAARPPSGCSFHPRCPLAFEPCGWEGRDLRQLLERRWTSQGLDAFAAERRVIANLDELETESLSVMLKPAAPHSVQEVRDLLGAVERDSSAEPFWRGVAEIATEGDGVVVRFHEAKDVALTAVANREVACLLFTKGDGEDVPPWRDVTTGQQGAGESPPGPADSASSPHLMRRQV
jgi:oligopeptide/dipeptide ABC transporter ATP-binding protein